VFDQEADVPHSRRSPSAGPSPEGSPHAVPGVLRPLRLDQPTGHGMAHRAALGTVGVAVQGLVRFLTSLFVGRLAGPSVLGVVQSAISTALLLSLLWPTTTGSAASKFVARARGAGDTEQIYAVAAHLRRRTVQAAVLLAIVSIPVWITIDDGHLGDALCVAALLLGYSGYSFTRGLQFGAGQIPRATFWDVSSAALGIASLLIALLLGARGGVLLLPLAASYGLYTLAGWPWGARGTLPSALRREIDGFVAIGVAGTLASTGFLQLSVIVARLVDTDAHVGQYAAALALATPASLLAGSLSLTLFPSMAEAWGRRDFAGFRRQTDQATRALVLVMVTTLGGIAVGSRFVVAVVWGDRYPEAADLLPVLLLAVLGTTIGVASVNALSTRSQRGMIAASGASLAGLVVGATVWAVLARDHGVMGIAIGYLAGTVVVGGAPLVTVWRTDRQPWTLLVLRLMVGVGVASVLVVLERATGLSYWYEPLLVVGFLTFWWVLGHRDVRAAVQLLRRTQPAADVPPPV
jgi:O-antigen/teichoic acid export membrane protein